MPKFIVIVLISLLSFSGQAIPPIENWQQRADKAIRLHDYETAATEYLNAAQHGDPQAQFQLANLYFLGKGVEKNQSKGLQHLEAAATQGYAPAQFNLGIQLLDDTRIRALELIQNAAQQSYAPAQKYIKNLNRKHTSAPASSNVTLDRWFAAARRGDILKLDALLAEVPGIDCTDSVGRSALFYAVEANRPGTFDWLIAQKASVDLQDKFGETPLHLAIKHQNTAMLESMLAISSNRSVRLSNGDNLLHYALRRDHAQALPHLLTHSTATADANKIALNQVNKADQTPLDLCRSHNSSTCLSSLQKAGAKPGKHTLEKSNINAKTITYNEEIKAIDDMIPVVLAGNVSAVQALLSEQPELARQPLENGNYLLTLAAINGDATITEALIANGASQPEEQLSEALTAAVLQKNGTIVTQLLDAGANPLAKTKREYDTIELAMHHNLIEMAKLLLQWTKVNSTLQDHTPYDHYLLIAAQDSLTDLVPILLEHHQQPVCDKMGRNALWYAAEQCNPTLVQHLLKNDFNPEATDNEGRSPLLIAVKNNCPAATEILLTATPPDIATHAGITSLMAAARAGNSTLVSKLLAHNANPKLRDRRGNTALIAAVEADCVSCVQQLLNAGAYKNRKNNLGLSAVDIAETLQKDVFQFFENN